MPRPGEPLVTEFLGTVDVVRSNQLLQKDEELIRICAGVETEVNELTAEIAQRFQELDYVAREISADPTAQGFRNLEARVAEHHAGISGVLCGLTVKMGVWEKLFPDKAAESPAKLADFITHHMKRGLQTMQEAQVATVSWELENRL